MSFGMSGVYCAAVTPLNADLSPDLKRLGEHCLSLLADGCHGIALLGTTGEANSFSVRVTSRPSTLPSTAATSTAPAAYRQSTTSYDVVSTHHPIGRSDRTRLVG